MSEGEVVWEGPQIGSRNYDDYMALLEQVKERPNEWGRIAVFETQGPPQNLRRSLIDRIGTDARWELRAAKIDKPGEKRRFGLFARYRA